MAVVSYIYMLLLDSNIEKDVCPSSYVRVWSFSVNTVVVIYDWESATFLVCIIVFGFCN